MNPQLGILTALQKRRALLGASVADTWIYQDGKRTTTINGNFIAGPSYFGTLMVGGSERVFAGLGSGAPPLESPSYLFDPNDDKHGTRITNVYTHGFIYGRSHSFSLLDLDGDGDLDLVENDTEATIAHTGGGFAIHSGDLATGPSLTAQPVPAGSFQMPQSEDPFLAIGAAKGRLLVSDADPRLPNQYPLRVTALGCRP